MQQANYDPPLFFKQKGVTLIEVLISILLMAIIGLGGAFIAGRTAVLHRDQNVHLHTINQMRNLLEHSQCMTPTTSTKVITVAEQSIDLDCTYVTGFYTVQAFEPPITGSTTLVGVESSGPGVGVNYPILQVKDSDTFVPIKVEIAP